MKYSRYIGVLAVIVLIAACFIPWTYYPDLDKTFNGFFSEKNIYGKPGKVFIFFGIIIAALFLISKVWAKRLNMLLAAILVAYSIKTYSLFTTCYRGNCPEKKEGIYIMVIAALVVLTMSIFPDMKLKEADKTSAQ